MTERLEMASVAAWEAYVNEAPEDGMKAAIQAAIADLIRGLEKERITTDPKPGFAIAYNAGRTSVLNEIREMAGLNPPELSEDVQKWADFNLALIFDQ